MPNNMINVLTDTSCFKTSSGAIVSNWRAKDGRSLQPIVLTDDGCVRFLKNGIIEYLFKSGKLDLNTIAAMDFSRSDQEQIAQMLGYSVSGYGDLSYVTKESLKAAEIAASLVPHV